PGPNVGHGAQTPGEIGLVRRSLRSAKMKSCPTCKRTFEDTFTFCLIDGAILSAPFDPLATHANPEVRNTGQARTEVLTPDSLSGYEPPAATIPSPPPSVENAFAPPNQMV